MSEDRRFVVYADGAARGNPGPAGAGAVLLDERGNVVAELSRGLGRATNNVAEYSALILGLEEARRRDATAVDVRLDSKLVVEQMRGVWRIRHPGLKDLALRAGALLASFPEHRIRHVPRAENAHADALANRAVDESNGQAKGARRSGLRSASGGPRPLGPYPRPSDPPK